MCKNIIQKMNRYLVVIRPDYEVKVNDLTGESIISKTICGNIM